MSILEKLDDQQRQAALAPDGIVKVMAGAGTGKTTTLMGRVSHLLESGIRPENIMVVTFTRKAANEFKTRLIDDIGEEKATQIRVGTFHSYCARFLRRHAALAGMADANFILADDSDVEQLILRAVEESGVVPAFEPPERPDGIAEGAYNKMVKAAQREYTNGLKDVAEEAKRSISRWKESGLTTDMIEAPGRERRPHVEEMHARIYLSYQNALETRNMMDFSDLLLKTAKIFDQHPDILKAEAARNRHLMVDEFQDCNLTQARLVDQLSSVHGNLMVVGDTDQSIYGFRAACPAIMEQLTGGGIMEITLVNNRRSVQPILDAANLIVDYVKGRAEPKVLNSALDEADRSETLRVAEFPNDFAEAADAVTQIQKLLSKGVPPKEIAILTRMARMSLPFEDQLIRRHIPYKIWKGTSLLEKGEMRDILSYLKLAANPRLDTAFIRACNRPTRGLGDAAMNAILELADRNGLTYGEACSHLAMRDLGVRVRQDAKEAAASLSVLLADIADMARSDADPVSVIEHILRETKYRDWLLDQGKDAAFKGNNHIELLLDIASDFDNVYDFLNDIHLMTDVDAQRDDDDKVQIMTIHAAKGLEFDHVFVPGLEDGTMPHKSAYEDDAFIGSMTNPWVGPDLGGTNEERCLTHVAFTRARKGLNVSYAKKRGFGTEKTPMTPSPFLAEAELTDLILRPQAAPRPRRRSNPEPDFRPVFGFGSRR